MTYVLLLKQSDCGASGGPQGGFAQGNTCASGDGSGKQVLVGDEADNYESDFQSDGGRDHSGDSVDILDQIIDSEGEAVEPTPVGKNEEHEAAILDYSNHHQGYAAHERDSSFDIEEHLPYSHDFDLGTEKGKADYQEWHAQETREFKKRVASLDEITHRKILKNGKTTSVYRGCDGTEIKAILKQIDRSDTIQIKPMISTSTEWNVAKGFEEWTDVDGTETAMLLKFRTDEGAYIAPLSAHDESEVLLPRNTKWRVAEKERVDKWGDGNVKWFITLERSK
mgnify:CR=1 FL=1|jgi:hypothetical protein